jgi:hypothetical protein
VSDGNCTIITSSSTTCSPIEIAAGLRMRIRIT